MNSSFKLTKQSVAEAGFKVLLCLVLKFHFLQCVSEVAVTSRSIMKTVVEGSPALTPSRITQGLDTNIQSGQTSFL